MRFVALLVCVGAVVLRKPTGPPPGPPAASSAPASADASLDVPVLNATNGSNYTPSGCVSQYHFGDMVLGDIEAPVTVDFRLMNLSHQEAEVRYCVDMNPKFNGDLFIECRDAHLIVENSSCYADIYDPIMLDFHIGVFEPTPEFQVNTTQWINMTMGANPPQTAPWDQFILRFNEVVVAGTGAVKITEINPPSVRRDFLGPEIDVPVEDYYQVFFGEENYGDGVAVIKSKTGHLRTKNGGQFYMIDIPEGLFLDRAGNPARYYANSTTLHLEFKVMDITAPHVVMDWAAAFFPMHGDQGRFVHHNITITMDEPVYQRGLPDAVIKLEPRYSDDVACYEEFQVHGCGPVYLDEDHTTIVLPLYGPQVRMLDDGHTIALYPGTLEFGVTYAVVIAHADFQDISGQNFTGLGTLKQGNYFFTTATMSQMQLKSDIEFFINYDERRLNDTMEMFHVKSANDMPWQDSFAKLRLLTLTWAIGEAQKILIDPYGLPVESDLQLIVDELKRDRFEPRGVPFSEPWVCDDFASHMLQSVGFTCSPAVQKAGNGFDIATRTASFFYRDGCLCQSTYVNNCPFSTQAPTTYHDFGFVAMDQKVVGPGNALCWYWATSSNPEYGYLSSPSNYFNATDPSDEERLKRQFWTWDNAHRPTEAAARDPLKDHYGIDTSLMHRGRVSHPDTPPPRTPPRPLPASARRMRLKRPQHNGVRPSVPKTVVPAVQILDAISRVLPTPPPEPPSQPTRYPAHVADELPPMEKQPLPPQQLHVQHFSVPQKPNFEAPMNPNIWYGHS